MPRKYGAKKAGSVVEEVVKDISGMIYDATDGKLGKDPNPMTPAKIAERNRQNGAEIISILKGISVKHGTYRGTREGDISPDKLEKSIHDAVTCLEEANTIEDDVSQIDSVLLYAAKALSAGVKDNQPEKVKWAKNAICAGAIRWRYDIPEDHAAERKANLKARAEYMEYYKGAIQNAEVVDDKTADLEKLRTAQQDTTKVYADYRKEVLEIGNTEEGQRYFGEIENNAATPGKLSKGAQEFSEKLTDAAITAHKMVTQNAQIITVSNDLMTAKRLLEDYGARLKNQPHAYSPDRMAEYATLLDTMEKELATSLAEADEANRLSRNFEAAIDAILSGTSIQDLHAEVRNTLNQLLSVEQLDTADLETGAKKMEKYFQAVAEQARAKEAQAEKLRQAQEEAERAQALAEEAAREKEIAYTYEPTREENFDVNPNMNTV